MLTNFSVTGYRNFENELNFNFRSDADFDFNLECIKDGVVKTAIIYGQNSSGKSNLGKAIIDIDYFLNNRTIDIKDSILFLNGNTKEEIIIFSYEFRFDVDVVTLIYHRNKDAQLVYEELKINKELIYKFDHDKNKMIEENLAKIEAETLNFTMFGNNLLNGNKNSLLGYILNFTNSTVIILEKFAKFTSRMVATGGTSTTVDAVYKYIIDRDWVEEFNLFLNDFDIKDEIVKITKASGEENLGIRYKNKVTPFSETASKGTIALAYFFYLYKFSNMISFIYIDEFDAFYHVELSQKLIELLKGIDNIQVVFTTHNTNLLANKILRPDCYFILGNNKITPLHKATRRELDEGHNLERLYIGGEFNA